MNDRFFEITMDHLKLIKRFHVDWQTGYDGAPAVDCKRPYGNKDIVWDIVHILRLENYYDEDDELIASKMQMKKIHDLHREMEKVLQICFATISFEPGIYFKRDEFSYTSWKKVDGDDEEYRLYLRTLDASKLVINKKDFL